MSAAVPDRESTRCWYPVMREESEIGFVMKSLRGGDLFASGADTRMANRFAAGRLMDRGVPCGDIQSI